MKVNVAILALIVGLGASVMGWGVSVESRLAKEAEALNLSNRIRAMEELMLPLLIDWKTHKELQKWQQENIKKVKGQVDKGSGSKITPIPIEEVPAPVRHNVDTWAKNVFKSQSAEEPDGKRLIQASYKDK